MAIIACGQNEIMPDTCVECGGWLHAERRNGFSGPTGRVCSEDCAADATEQAALQDQRQHVRMRDLMCTCEVCAVAGHPTQAEQDEYRAYQHCRDDSEGGPE